MTSENSAGVTLAFVSLAYVVTAGFGVREYLRLCREKTGVHPAPPALWVLRLLAIVVMLGPVVK